MSISMPTCLIAQFNRIMWRNNMTVQDLCNKLQNMAHDGKSLMEITDINGKSINVFEDEDSIYIAVDNKQGNNKGELNGTV